MDFKPSTIGGLFDSKISFTIPIYQRAYSWDKANWSVFLEDIIEQSCRDNGYSYGNILLEIIKEDALYEIIDGQQSRSPAVWPREVWQVQPRADIH